MKLDNNQLNALLGLVASTQDDKIDCDNCFDHVAEFADARLAGKPLSDALKAVQTHLESCPCCADEYRALLEGLAGLDDGADS